MKMKEDEYVSVHEIKSLALRKTIDIVKSRSNRLKSQLDFIMQKSGKLHADQ